MSKNGVHQGHCCAIHGCKYMDEECPVILRQVQQDHFCEDCELESRKVVSAMAKAVELGVMQDTHEMRSALKQILQAAQDVDFEDGSIETSEDRYKIYIQAATELGWTVKTYDDWLNS